MTDKKPAMIRIISRSPGYRRGGIAHPASKDYPVTDFTRDQLATFRADPHLTVIDGPDETASEDRALLQKMLEMSRDELVTVQEARDQAVQKLQSNAADASKVITDLKQELGTAQTRIIALETDNKALQDRIAELELEQASKSGDLKKGSTASAKGSAK